MTKTFEVIYNPQLFFEFADSQSHAIVTRFLVSSADNKQVRATIYFNNGLEILLEKRNQ